MRILQLGKFYPIRGGVEKVMWDLTRGLGAAGVDCDMLCASFEPQTIELNAHARCICLKAWKKVAATMICPSMPGWLRRHAREYDIVHVHHPDPMACLALRLSGFKGKVILHWHSDILKQKGLLTLYKPLQGWLIRRADRIVGTTPVYVAQSAALKDVQNKVTWLPIGIEDNIADPALRKENDGRITVFSLGRLVEYKGFRYLVDAARYLPGNCRIVIGGTGPLEADLRMRIAELPEGCASVELAGYLSDEDVRRWYNECDLFCLSSIMKTEAFAIVQIEAMSCGKPVVATHIPGSGVDWVNSDGESGLNVSPCDPAALAEAILKISAGTSLQEYGRRARTRYEAMFTYDVMVDRCRRIYDEVEL